MSSHHTVCRARRTHLPVGRSVCSAQRLMLMRRARAYSSSCLQIVLIYLHHHFVAIHASAGENRRKITRLLFCWVQSHLRSSMLIPLKSMSPVLVIISSMFVNICNRFYDRRANSGKITTFRCTFL